MHRGDLPSRAGGRWSAQLDRGLSVESTARRLVGRDEATTQPRARFGWLVPELITCLNASRARRSNPVVAVYGNSFAKRLGEAIHRVSPRVAMYQVTAPLATQSWTFAAWQDTHELIDADVEIFTVTSGRVPYTASMSPMLHLVDPYAYFNPRYVLASGSLARIDPVIRTLEDLRRALYSDPSMWCAQRQQLAERDPFFDPFVFDDSALDRIALTRVARRVRRKVIRQGALRRVLERSGFRADSEEIQLVNAMIGGFARGSLAGNRVPIVYLVSVHGHGVRLQRAVEDTLRTAAVVSVSSHEVCPPEDPSCFSGEHGHFTRSRDDQIAREVIRRAELGLAGRSDGRLAPPCAGRGRT